MALLFLFKMLLKDNSQRLCKLSLTSVDLPANLISTKVNASHPSARTQVVAKRLATPGHGLRKRRHKFSTGVTCAFVWPGLKLREGS